MKDSEFLSWIWQRMVNVHGEQSNVDYMLRLNGIILAMKDKDTESAISFEQPKPRTKTEFVKSNMNLFEIIDFLESGKRLYTDDIGSTYICQSNYKEWKLKDLLNRDFYTEVETEIDDRQEFIDKAMEIAKREGSESDRVWVGMIFDELVE